MNTNFLILITVVIVLIVFLVLFFLMKKLASKKANVPEVLEKVDTGITFAQALAQAINPFLPTVANNIIMIILSRAQQAVAHVEATYKAAIATGQAAIDSRKDEATNLIKSALALEGIQETEDIDKLINTVIPMLVLALPKTHEDKGDTPVTAAHPESGAVASDTTGAK